MGTAKNSRYGRVERGDTIPYGTLADASPELRKAYYCAGYRNDDDMPPLPCPPLEEEPYLCPEEELFKKELVAAVNDALNTMGPRISKVLRMRFGFDGSHEMTLEEVGYAFRVSRERIRQIEAKALRQLKHPSRSDALRAVLFPRSREDVIIEQRRYEREHRELTAKLAEAANAQHERTKKFDAEVYKETDVSWLDYVKRVDPELHKLVMANADRIMKERGWNT